MTIYSTNLKIEEKLDSISKKISIEIEEKNLDEFQLKMILGGCDNIVKPSVRYEDSKVILEYDVSNMTNFEKIFNVKKSVTEIIDIVLDLIEIINQSTNNYLDYSLFLMDKKFMYFDNMNFQVMLIYVPVLDFKMIDILQSLKSELFKDASNVYRDVEYSNLLFTIMKASTISALKHSLIELESNLYNEKKVSGDIAQKDDIKVEKIDLADSEKSIKNNKKGKKIKVKKVDDTKYSINKNLKLAVSVVVSLLIISLFILASLTFSLPIIPSVIIGVVISILIVALVSKFLENKPKEILKINNSKDNNQKYYTTNHMKETNESASTFLESKTVLISDIKSKQKLVNLESGEIYKLIFTSNNILSLGRSKSADVYIEESSIGRNHLNIISQSDELYMCDNNSLNGSYINETQLQPLKNYLASDGDIICVGETKLKLQIG